MLPERTAYKSADVGQIKLSYVDRGLGQAAVFVHGFPVSGRIWDVHREALEPRIRMIAPTLRYFGSSPWVDDGRNFSLQTHADDLAAFISALELDPVPVVGWSYGGSVALTLAVHHPQLVERLFLFEPTLISIVADPDERQRALADRHDMIKRAKNAAEKGDLGGAMQLFIDALNSDDGLFDRSPERVQSLMLEGQRLLPIFFACPPPPVTSDDLGKLRMPVTIAVGGDSRAFYKIIAGSASRYVPNIDLVTVPNARHMLPMQDPRIFSRLVLESIERG